MIVAPAIVGAALVGASLVAPNLVNAASGPATVRTLTVDPVTWSERPQDFERGTAGSSMLGFYATVGSSAYVFTTHTWEGSDVGIDPGDYESALSGRTGYEATFGAGSITAQAAATALATAFALVPGVTSAAAASSGNTDGSWNVEVTTELAIATGTRAWGSRGAAGMHGGHGYRCAETGDAGGTSQFNITRWLANRVATPPSSGVFYAVQCMLGDTVDTAAANRPRLMLLASTSATSPSASTEIVYDFGQLPASQVVAGQAGTIFLTPAQSAALRTAIDDATGTNWWLTIASATGNSYSALATGAGVEGEAIDQGVRVEVTTGTNDPTSAPTDWSATGELNFAFLTGLRLCYVTDPCTTGEIQKRWGAFLDYADYSSDVVLPDSQTGYRAPIAGLERMRVLEISTGAVAGTIRYQIAEGGTHTPDAPSMSGATTIWDAGINSTTGAGSITAPTGASTVRFPSSGSAWAMFKGQGATGRGDAGPAPFTATGRVDQPSDWIRRTDGGGFRGTTVSERDNAGTGLGDDSTVWPDPIVIGTETAPFNHSSNHTILHSPAITIGTL